MHSLFTLDKAEQVRSRASLAAEEVASILSLLHEFANVFTWSHADMPGVLLELIEHRLSVRDSFRPIRQRLRQFHPVRQEVIKQEVDRLLEASFIREIQYLEWLSNVVVVPKKNGKWRVCVDYTNFNDACQKDLSTPFWPDPIS